MAGQVIPSLKPLDRRRAFEEILLQLEEAMTARHLEPGDRLPPERELASTLGVSRTSVREAVRVLEALGIVRVRRGADNGAVLLERPENALSRILGLQLALRHISLESLVQFRALVEAWAVRRVASSRPAGALAELERMVADMERSALGREQFHELDTSFHFQLVHASGNELVTLVLEGTRTAIAHLMLEAIAAAGDWDATRQRLAGEHRAILDAVAGGRGQDATELVERHIRTFYEDFLHGRDGR
jgi:GntR family transcriptional regulator, transcriptional repressor for pyruvate dehydrogenase complex